MKNKNITWIICIIVLLQAINVSAQSKFVADYEGSKSEVTGYPTLDLYFHSWGENGITLLDLDNYFKQKRTSNLTYTFLPSSKIDVIIDQETGIAKLKAREDWTGTEKITFALLDTNNIPIGEAREKLIESESRKKIKITEFSKESQLEEFRDALPFDYLDSLIEKLESRPIEKSEITASIIDKKLNVKTSDGISLLAGFSEKEQEGIKIKKPEVSITITPNEEAIEVIEEEKGMSILILIPLFFIILVALIIAFTYIKDNYHKIKKFLTRFTKKESIKEKIEEIVYITNYIKEINALKDKAKKLTLEELSNNFFSTINSFLETLVHPKYEFTYEEIKKELQEKKIPKDLKERTIKLLDELISIRYGKKLTREDILRLLPEIEEIIRRAESILKEKAIKPSKPKLQNIIEFLHKLGLFRTHEEELRIQKRGLEEDKKKEKEKAILLKAKIKARERRRLILKKLLHDYLGLFKTQREIEKERIEREKLKKLIELQKIEEKKEIELEKLELIKEKRKERSRIVREVLHKYLGLFKTPEEKRRTRELKLEKFRHEVELKKIKYQERLKIGRERERGRRVIKRALKESLHNLGLFKTQEEKSAIQKRRLEEKREREEKRALALKARIRERKRRTLILKNFLHSLGLFKTQEEKEEATRLKYLAKLKKEREKQLLELEKRKRVIQSTEEIQIPLLLKKAKEAVSRGKTEEARVLEKQINKLYKALPQKIGKVKLLFTNVKQKLSIADKKLKSFSQREIFKPVEKHDEASKTHQARYLLQETEKAINRSSINLAKELYDRAFNIYKGLDNKEDLTLKLTKVKNALTSELVTDYIKKAEFLVKSGKLKEAEQLYEKVNELYYTLPSDNRDKVASKKSELSQKLIPAEDRISIEKVSYEKEYLVEKTREPEVKEKRETPYIHTFLDYIKGSKPKFNIPIGTRTKLIQAKQEPKKDYIKELYELIDQVRDNLTSKNYEQANTLYKIAVHKFTELPISTTLETKKAIYRRLLPFKEQILETSINKLMVELQQQLRKGNINKAKELQQQIDDIYTHLAMTKKPSSLINFQEI